MEKTTILEAINITKRFPGVLANDKVCLDARYGEILGLIGENGAGKSTLLKVLNGVYPTGTYEGHLFLEGKEIRMANPQDAMRIGIGYVPQEINVLKNFSVAENIYMANLKLEGIASSDTNDKKTNFHFIDFKKMHEECKKLLRDNKINLDPRADVRKLSIGQQQMLMIARALASNPKVLILDEPTTSLSNSDVERLFTVVRNLKEKGLSVIFVTHKLDEIMDLTDRVTILRDGRNINTFEKKEYNETKIIADMIGRTINEMYPKRESHIGEEIFRVENITVPHPYIANRDLIHNVSFSVHKGEVLGLGGLVGAGRSEVCLATFGMMPMSSGRIYLNQKEIHIKSTKDAVKYGIGMISEDRKKYGLNFKWGLKENITISNLDAVSYGTIVSGKKIENRANQYYNGMSIKASSLDTKVITLSGGNQQKVVIARTLNAEPKVIIMDEPTKGIDVGSKNEIYALINQLVAQGTAIILISSELPELIAMSDRVVIMSEGRVAGELEKGDITEMNIMQLATRNFRKEEETEGGRS